MEVSRRSINSRLLASRTRGYGKFVWSPKIENATPFSTLEEADAKKRAVPDATGVIEFNDKWYVVKER
jgi:hypothetical protein